MPIISPYRPVTKPPPQTQPTNISLGAAGKTVLQPADLTVQTLSDRRTIFSGNMSQNFVEDTPISSNPGNWLSNPFLSPPYNESVMDFAYTTLNGSPAIALTWYGDAAQSGNPNFADWTDRWGARMYLPTDDSVGWLEGWFTIEVHFSSPFGNYSGMKLPGLRSHPQSATPSPGSEPTGTFLGYTMLSDNKEDTTGDREAHEYIYDYVKSGQRREWDGGAGVIGLEELWTIETYFKYNTAAGVADGIFRTKADAGAGAPTTVRRNETGLKMWATGGAPVIGVRGFTFEMGFYGGNSTWNPNATSTITLGAWAFEVPS